MHTPADVVVADDHPLFRKALAETLLDLPEVANVHLAANGKEALSLVHCYHPALVVLDTSMPELDGIAATREIKRLYPKTHVLIISMHKEEEVIRQAIQGGALGYLPKEAEPETITAAVLAVLKGELYLAPEIERRLAINRLRNAESDVFTPRELQVVRLLSQGRTTAQIADTLCLGNRTVERLRSNLLVKSGAKNTVELVHFANGQGLLAEKM